MGLPSLVHGVLSHTWWGIEISPRSSLSRYAGAIAPHPVTPSALSHALMAMHVFRRFLEESVSLSLFERREDRHRQLARRLWRELHGHPRTRPFSLVDKVNVQRMFQMKMERVVIRHVGLAQVKPSLRSLPTAGDLRL